MQHSQGPYGGCLGVANGFPPAPGACRCSFLTTKLGGDGATAAPSPCKLSGAHQHSPWAGGECWHEEPEGSEWDCELPKLQFVIFSQALTATCPFCNGDRKDYKQSLPPKQFIFTRKIEEQGKGQFCLVS